MTCARCQELSVSLGISTPGQLSNALRVVKANLADGTLRELPATSATGTLPFAQIDVDGPWADVISYRFECCSCRQTFDLAAETYHGGGGTWAPL